MAVDDKNEDQNEAVGEPPVIDDQDAGHGQSVYVAGGT